MVAPLTNMRNRRKLPLVGCFVMGILNREAGEIELIPVAKGGTGQTTVNGILTTLGFLGNNIAIGQQAGSIDLDVNANTIASKCASSLARFTYFFILSMVIYVIIELYM